MIFYIGVSITTSIVSMHVLHTYQTVGTLWCSRSRSVLSCSSADSLETKQLLQIHHTVLHMELQTDRGREVFFFHLKVFHLKDLFYTFSTNDMYFVQCIFSSSCNLLLTHVCYLSIKQTHHSERVLLKCIFREISEVPLSSSCLCI